MRHYFKYLLQMIVAIGISSANAQSYEDFFRAVDRDDGRSVAQWLARGVDPNTVDPKGQTALHLAMRDGDLQVAEALLQQPNLNVNALNASAESPLMLAALRGRLDWCQRLLERGAKLHFDGWSPIHYAATGSEPRVVAMLLDKGAPLEALSPNRSTPLMMAAGYGAEGNVDLLLTRGADLRRRNDLGLDAAEFARRAGREFLLVRLTAAPR